MQLPLGDTAPLNWKNSFINTKVRDSATGINVTDETPLFSDVAGDLWAGAYPHVSIDNSKNLEVDLTSATTSTITDLRRAFKLQEWLEKKCSCWF